MITRGTDFYYIKIRYVILGFLLKLTAHNIEQTVRGFATHKLARRGYVVQ